MNRSEPKAKYAENWDKQFESMEALYARIAKLADEGAYHLCVYIDSTTTYHEVKAALTAADYDVEDYNGGNNGILEVSWG